MIIFFTRAIENATSIEAGIVLNMQCEYITWLEHLYLLYTLNDMYIYTQYVYVYIQYFLF